MPLWGWILIVAGIVLIGYIKLKVFKNIMEKKKGKVTFKDED